MSYERPMHVSAMSKLLNTGRLSMAVTVASWTGTLIVRPGGKSATSSGTVGSTWSLLTLAGELDHVI